MSNSSLTEDLLVQAIDALLRIKNERPIDWSNANLLLRESSDAGTLSDALRILNEALDLAEKEPK